MSSSHQESVVQSQPRTSIGLSVAGQVSSIVAGSLAPIIATGLLIESGARSDLTVDPGAQRSPVAASRR